MPLPIQSGSMTERLRKFFRIRGKTAFALDEIVAPVVLVQDLTVGPYQAGVTPAAGEIIWSPAGTTNPFSVALMLNDKPGSITEILDRQFNNRSFSVTYLEMQNVNQPTPQFLAELTLVLASRADVFATGVPSDSSTLTSIQDNDGTLGVPVELFNFAAADAGASGKVIWRGFLGDNTNTLGSRRTIEPTPQVTIGPDDALVFASGNIGQLVDILLHVRGFYQQQPA